THTFPTEIFTLSLHDALPIFKDFSEETLTLQIGGTTFKVKNELEHQFQINDVVDCVMKPEFWSISAQGNFSAEIVQSTFLGSHMEYLVQIENQSFKFFDYFHFEDRKSTRLNSSHVSISYAVL